MKGQYYALIPAYEPDEHLAELVDRLSEEGFRIVVVDDGSSPACREVFAAVSSRAAVLSHPANRGKGQALKTGLTYIKKHCDPDDVVVTVDADGQHKVEDALRLCDLAAARPEAMVLGGRHFTGNVPLRSRLGNTFTRLAYRLASGARVYDTQTGLRAFRAGLADVLLAIPGDRYEYEMKVLLELPGRQVPILEEEIETIYINGNAASHFSAVRDSLRILREILRFSAASLAGFAVDYALYSLLLPITGSLALANVGARCVSATVNYNLNRIFVFRSGSHSLKSAVSYCLLAAGILAGNTGVLAFLVKVAGVNALAAKLVTEMGFFAVSYLVQKLVIFRRGAGGAEGQGCTRVAA